MFTCHIKQLPVILSSLSLWPFQFLLYWPSWPFLKHSSIRPQGPCTCCSLCPKGLSPGCYAVHLKCRLLGEALSAPRSHCPALFFFVTLITLWDSITYICICLLKIEDRRGRDFACLFIAVRSALCTMAGINYV